MYHIATHDIGLGSYKDDFNTTKHWAITGKWHGCHFKKTVEPIPNILYKEGIPIKESERCEEFAKIFENNCKNYCISNE